MTVPGSVADGVAAVQARVADAARRAGRDPSEVRVVAATKTRSIEAISAVVEAGIHDLGENRAQELVAKGPALASLDPVWHFIGRLQRNKINQLAPWVGWWHSIDRLDLGDALARRVPGARVLVEVNVGAEPQKGGAAPSATPALVEHLRELGLDVVGLMTVAPATGDPARMFEALQAMAARLELSELSMGMSNDFEAAIAHGATMVRLGTALFGARPTFPGSGPPGR